MESQSFNSVQGMISFLFKKCVGVRSEAMVTSVQGMLYSSGFLLQ